MEILVGKSWLDLQFNQNGTIKKPDEIEHEMQQPPKNVDPEIFNRIHGSMVGMATGDALGAHVEFRPRGYLMQHPVTELAGGGTWGLEKGQFTDDTSMALCLANSLVARRGYVPYDQLVRYKWWHESGYMSSTGRCFDIGAATKRSLNTFKDRQKKFAEQYKISYKQMDYLSDPELLKKFDVNCSEDGVAGNGALMRLAPVPLFFHKHYTDAVEYSGLSGLLTHGDKKVYDACRYYGALIVAALNGATKQQLISKDFYREHSQWFGKTPLHEDIICIAEGSYQKDGYNQGIRGKGYIVNSLEAALWAFWSDEGSFAKGVLAAVNLGDDTDTTAAIYGQLAGACYGYDQIPERWRHKIYAKGYIECLSKWIAYEGDLWLPESLKSSKPPSSLVAQLSTEQDKASNILTLPDDSRQRSRSLLETTDSKNVDLNITLKLRREKSMEHKTHKNEQQHLYFLKNFNSIDDVCKEIAKLGHEFIVYQKCFREHEVDAFWLLNQVDNEALKRYGITNEHHRHTIMNHIDQLKKLCHVQSSIQEQ